LLDRPSVAWSALQSVGCSTARRNDRIRTDARDVRPLMTWTDWLRLCIEIVVATMIVATFVLTFIGYRRQRALEPQLGPADAALLLDLIEHEGPIANTVYPDERVFVVIDNGGDSFAVAQRGGMGRQVSRSAFSNLERLSLVAKTRGGFQVTPEGYSSARRLRPRNRRVPWR